MLCGTILLAGMPVPTELLKELSKKSLYPFGVPVETWAGGTTV